jgi:Ser-tRNA(Ala) deacylase AlaX
MTVRRYLDESGTVGDAGVVDVIEADQTLVRLDGTLFCPSSVFRHGDRGWLGSARVIDVFMQDSDIFHVVSGAQSFRIGAGVTMTIDPAWRKLNNLYTYCGFAICHLLTEVIFDVRLLQIEFRPENSRISFRSENKLDATEISDTVSEAVRRGTYDADEIPLAVIVNSFGVHAPEEASACHLYEGPKIAKPDVLPACKVHVSEQQGHHVLSYYASDA